MLVHQDNFTDTRLLRIQRQNSWEKKRNTDLEFHKSNHSNQSILPKNSLVLFGFSPLLAGLGQVRDLGQVPAWGVLGHEAVPEVLLQHFGIEGERMGTPQSAVEAEDEHTGMWKS